MNYVVPDPKAPPAERFRVVFNGILQAKGFPEHNKANDHMVDLEQGRVQPVELDSH